MSENTSVATPIKLRRVARRIRESLVSGTEGLLQDVVGAITQHTFLVERLRRIPPQPPAD